MIDQNKESILLYRSYSEIVRMLGREEAGDLFLALLEYEDEELPSRLSAAGSVAYRMIRAQILRDRDKYEQKCEQNRRNASSRRL